MAFNLEQFAKGAADGGVQYLQKEHTARIQRARDEMLGGQAKEAAGVLAKARKGEFDITEARATARDTADAEYRTQVQTDKAADSAADAEYREADLAGKEEGRESQAAFNTTQLVLQHDERMARAANDAERLRILSASETSKARLVTKQIEELGIDISTKEGLADLYKRIEKEDLNPFEKQTVVESIFLRKGKGLYEKLYQTDQYGERTSDTSLNTVTGEPRVENPDSMAVRYQKWNEARRALAARTRLDKDDPNYLSNSDAKKDARALGPNPRG